MAKAPSVSFLPVEEAFASGSPAFLDRLRKHHEPTPFPKFAEQWLDDRRPWARQQLFDYLDQPLNTLNHNSLVKRLFKGAERRNDDELMGAFAVAFDRLIRRVRKTRNTYDPASRRYVPIPYLKSPRDTLAPLGAKELRPESWLLRFRLGLSAEQRLFSYHTRRYVQRRAWRYFRYAGHRRPADYVARVAQLLTLYTDDDLPSRERVMDSWTLLHAAFGEADGLVFKADRARLRAGTSIASLPASPAFGPLWQAPAATELLLMMVGSARARLVRIWAAQLLERWHLQALGSLPLDRIAPLLASPDEPLRSLGLALLASAANLDRTPFPAWLQLLQITDLTVLDAVTAAMRKHLDPASVGLFDAVTLAKSAAAPVARLGLSYLQGKSFDTPAARQALAHVADARSSAVAYEIAAWALGVLGRASAYAVDPVSRFFDSLSEPVRSAARDWLTPDSGGWGDPALWARLLESPFDDVRLFLVDTLVRRQSLPGTAGDALVPLWTGVLLNIHRGGRRKLAALRQISGAVRADPASAARLMPVLAVAIRSVRAPEARAGLSAVVSAVAARPDLMTVVRQALPELEMPEMVTT